MLELMQRYLILQHMPLVIQPFLVLIKIHMNMQQFQI